MHPAAIKPGSQLVEGVSANHCSRWHIKSKSYFRETLANEIVTLNVSAPLNFYGHDKNLNLSCRSYPLYIFINTLSWLPISTGNW